ncbi:MAG: hypothetical protein IJZ35_06065 [Clostridia bacterium]|nr:hypothetical protein [Clostridia bacterium]
MFVIVNVKPSGKRKIKKGKTVEKVYDHFNAKGERFYIADVLDSEKGVDWNEVSHFLGRHASHILLNKNIILPENAPVGRFDPVAYKNLLIFNTLELLLKQMFLAGCRTSCYINDPKGDYFSFLSKVARYSARTTVITANRFRYITQAAKMYSDFGAGVSVTERAQITDDNAVVIDTAGTLFGKRGVVFSPFNNGITPKYTDGFNDLKVLCPAYIEPVDFLGAVYELNHDKRLHNAVCRTFSFEGNDIKALELLERLVPKSAANETSIIFTV